MAWYFNEFTVLISDTQQSQKLMCCSKVTFGSWIFSFDCGSSGWWYFSKLWTISLNFSWWHAALMVKIFLRRNCSRFSWLHWKCPWKLKFYMLNLDLSITFFCQQESRHHFLSSFMLFFLKKTHFVKEITHGLNLLLIEPARHLFALGTFRLAKFMQIDKPDLHIFDAHEHLPLVPPREVEFKSRQITV